MRRAGVLSSLALGAFTLRRTLSQLSHVQLRLGILTDTAYLGSYRKRSSLLHTTSTDRSNLSMAALVFEPLSYIGIIFKLYLSNVVFCSWPQISGYCS
jgi:hypothetical protein